MDIRAWLQPKNKKTVEPKKRRIEDDDDDDIIQGSPDVQIINKKKKSSHRTDTSKSKNKPVNDKPLKEVKATNLFGNGSIKRTEPLVKKVTKKTETGIHSDEEFEKSLLEIDDLDQLDCNGDEKKQNNYKLKSPNKVNAPKESSSKTKDDLKSETSAAKSNNESEPSTSKTKSKDDCKSGIFPVKSKIESEPSTSKTKSKDDCKSGIFPATSKIESEPSTSRHSNKHLSSKKVDDIKREIKETNKRKFSEFAEADDKNDLNENNKMEIDTGSSKINGDTTKTNNHGVSENDSLSEDFEDSKSKKRCINKSLNESVLTDEERHERKMYSAKLYQSYLNRSGPKHLGAKEMPEGTPNCLKDMAFLLTGVLDSFEREEIVETINKYGGCIKNSISKKVSHVLAGEDAGPAKMAKARDLNIKIINEDDFLKIIKDSNETRTETNKEVKKEKEPNKKLKTEIDKEKKKNSKEKHQQVNGSSNKDKIEKSEVRKEKSNYKHKDKNAIEKMEITSEKPEHNQSENSKNNTLEVKQKNRAKSTSPTKMGVVKIEKDLKSERETKSSTHIINTVDESKSATDVNQSNNVKSSKDAISGTMWVEKYKPKNVKQIIGQLGEKSNVTKLINWLTKWYVNRKAKLPKPNPWAKNDDGGFYKAALLSGPPGVGKTTTVALVCKQLGFDMVEFNASDTRSKTLIKEQIGELLTTTSLSAYAKGDTGKQAVTKKHVLVMDEVDGMAGNEDRGGLQELIGLIKTSSVPIICMCNDRNSQKMRSLVNYCYDLRFSRPRVEQIKAAMRSICCKENIKIPPDVLGQLIISANQDVRQTLNLLSMWAIDPSLMEPERLSKDAAVAKKDVKLGPWEAIRKVFSAEDHKKMSINDKSDLFFYDYSLAPLFVQENYLQVQPHCPKHEVLQRVSQAADSISFGDTIEKKIRSAQTWSLLPMQAMYSSVLPGHYLSGHVAGQIQFPGWLGKNSRANKMHRFCQEIHAHARLSTTGSKSSIFLDYSTHLRDAIITPLIKDKTDGIDCALEVLQSYNLLREDLDSLTELSVWPGQRNPTVLIDSKVKAAMTRTYNKKATALPYAPAAVKRGRVRDDEDAMEDEETVDDEEADSDPENDALIKKKKSHQTEKPSSSSDKPSSSNGKSGKGSSSSKGKKK